MKITNDFAHTRTFQPQNIAESTPLLVRPSAPKSYDFRADSRGLETRDLNYRIGALQAIEQIFSEILGDKNMSFEEILEKIHSAKFFSKPLFEQVIKDDSRVVFDGYKVLDMLPQDKHDIYHFKKSLKAEHKAVLEALEHIRENLSEDSANPRTARNLSGNLSANPASNLAQSALVDNVLLTSQGARFAKSHNIARLADKIDALLA